jgi:hypothetical protein
MPGATAIGAAFGAIENLTGNLAFEVSLLGVRVVCLRTVANLASRPIQDTMAFVAGRMNITTEQAIGQVALCNFLKVPATVKDTANAAVRIASDRARMMTGTMVNARGSCSGLGPSRGVKGSLHLKALLMVLAAAAIYSSSQSAESAEEHNNPGRERPFEKRKLS